MRKRKSVDGWWRGAVLLAGLLMTMPLPGRAIATTTVEDVVYRADGSIAQGTLLVSWPSFTAGDGSTVAGGSTTVTIGANGMVSLRLAPNEGAAPAGTYYTAVYHLSDGSVQKEYWVVPQSPTATITMMRAKVVPAAVAQPVLSQQILNATVQNATANYLPLKGGALTGALNLAADPQSGLQAATKQYVDGALQTSAANYLALKGGALTGALNLASDPQSGMQAATKQYVDGTVQTTAANYLPLHGGALTGALNLAADPQSGLQAATKQYVDGTVQTTAANYLPLQGGALTGALNLAADPQSGMQAATKQYVDGALQTGTASYLPLKGGALTGALNLAADPQSGLQAATKQYVDGALQTGTANYLPLKGGALTGALNLAADPQSALQAATKQYVDGALQTGTANYLPLKGGALTGALNLAADPQSALQAATKQYVDAHSGGAAPVLPTGIVYGQGTSAARPSTAADVAGTFHTNVTTTTTPTYISTTFNEGAAGATLAGTKPAVDATNDTWHFFDGTVNWNFAAGGGGIIAPAASGSNVRGATIDTGQANYFYHVAFTNIGGNTGTTSASVLVRYTDDQNVVSISLSQGGNVSVYEEIAGVFSQLGTATLDQANLNITLNGSSLIVAGDSAQTPLSVTLHAPNLTSTKVGFGFKSGSNATIANLRVYGVSSTTTASMPCAGYLNADGTCNAVTSNLLATDATGKMTALAEKATKTDAFGVTTIACDEDQGMGRFDARCSKYGNGGIFGPNSGQALQDLASAMGCYLAKPGSPHPTVYFPAGTFAVGTDAFPTLVFPAGGNYIGAGGRAGTAGVTIFQATYNNHNAVQVNTGQTYTCTDGSRVTLGGVQPNSGRMENIAEHGCGQGGCKNVPGDTGVYFSGGPSQGGIFYGESQGYGHNISASNNGDFGVNCGGQDSICDGIFVSGNMAFYYFGKGNITAAAPGTVTPAVSGTGGALPAGTYFYKVTALNGVGESTGSAEVTVTATGATSSVALSWPAVTNANRYRVYRGTTAGGEANFFASSGTSYTDTGAAFTGSGTVPLSNTTTYNPANDSGAHCNFVGSSTDGQFSHIETYGYFGVTGNAYGKVCGIFWGGGNTALTNVFTQVEEIGIMRTFGNDNGKLSDFRIESIGGEAIYENSTRDVISNGHISSACRYSDALNLVAQLTGSEGAHCDYIDDQGGNLYSNISMVNDTFFGASHASGAVWPWSPSTYVNVTQGGEPMLYENPAATPAGYGVTTYKRFGNATGAAVTGPAPNITLANAITPVDTATITYTGVTGGWVGQDFSIFVPTAKPNITLQGTAAGGHWHTCGDTGESLTLAKPGSYHYLIYQANIFAPLDYYPYSCPIVPAATVSETTETVASSAAPIFSTAMRGSYMVLTSSATFSLAAGTSSQVKYITVCQDATGGWTLTGPANLTGLMTISPAANSCSAQAFQWSTQRNKWTAVSAGVVNQ